MASVRATDRALVRELRAGLGTYVDGGRHACVDFMPPFLEAIGAEKGLSYSVRFLPNGLTVDIHHVSGLGTSASRTASVLQTSMQPRPGTFAPFDPARPQPDQRNRPLVLADLVARFKADEPPHGYQLYPRFGIYHLDQLRVLVCDGPSLLAWVGGWREEPFSERDRGLLQLLVPALRRRLVLERLITEGTDAAVSLAGALEAIPRPAFVVSAAGAVRHANAAGAALVERAPRATLAALRTSLARRPRSRYALFRISARGLPCHYLAVHNRTNGEAAPVVAAATHRLGLTVRQAAVLSLLARGCANRTIAALLDVAENTVEHHVSRLLRRVGVDSRAALLARCLAGL